MSFLELLIAILQLQVPEQSVPSVQPEWAALPLENVALRA